MTVDSGVDCKRINLQSLSLLRALKLLDAEVVVVV